jgi:hypothetical protein
MGKPMVRKLDLSGPVKVWKFRKYDMTTDEYVESARYGTQEAIARIGAELIEETVVTVNSSLLDSDGLTAKSFSPS